MDEIVMRVITRDPMGGTIRIDEIRHQFDTYTLDLSVPGMVGGTVVGSIEIQFVTGETPARGVSIH